MNTRTRQMLGRALLILAFTAFACTIGYLWQNNAALSNSTIAYLILGVIAIKVTATFGVCMAFGKFKTDRQTTLAAL